MSYQQTKIFSDYSERIPPDWNYDTDALAKLVSSTFKTQVVGKGDLHSTPYNADVRFLKITDLENLLKLHGKVIEVLPKKEIFRSDEAVFLETHLERRGRTVGAFIDNRLIGYAVISFPKGDDDNLGEFTSLDTEERLRVAHYDGACVDPDFRGSHLHRIMNRVRGKYACLAGYHHLMGTVSPLNPYSLMNHLGAGFQVIHFAKRYGGMDRLIIYRNGKTSEAPLWNETNLVFLHDRETIKSYLNQGYVGFDVVKIEGTYKLALGK